MGQCRRWTIQVDGSHTLLSLEIETENSTLGSVFLRGIKTKVEPLELQGFSSMYICKCKGWAGFSASLMVSNYNYDSPNPSNCDSPNVCFYTMFICVPNRYYLLSTFVMHKICKVVRVQRDSLHDRWQSQW